MCIPQPLGVAVVTRECHQPIVFLRNHRPLLVPPPSASTPPPLPLRRSAAAAQARGVWSELDVNYGLRNLVVTTGFVSWMYEWPALPLFIRFGRTRQIWSATQEVAGVWVWVAGWLSWRMKQRPGKGRQRVSSGGHAGEAWGERRKGGITCPNCSPTQGPPALLKVGAWLKGGIVVFTRRAVPGVVWWVEISRWQETSGYLSWLACSRWDTLGERQGGTPAGHVASRRHLTYREESFSHFVVRGPVNFSVDSAKEASRHPRRSSKCLAMGREMDELLVFWGSWRKYENLTRRHQISFPRNG